MTAEETQLKYRKIQQTERALEALGIKESDLGDVPNRVRPICASLCFFFRRDAKMAKVVLKLVKHLLGGLCLFGSFLGLIVINSL